MIRSDEGASDRNIGFFFISLVGGGRTAGRWGAKDNTEREGCIRREIKEREMVVLIKEGKGGSLGDIAYLYFFFCNRTKGLIKG